MPRFRTKGGPRVRMWDPWTPRKQTSSGRFDPLSRWRCGVWPLSLQTPQGILDKRLSSRSLVHESCEGLSGRRISSQCHPLLPDIMNEKTCVRKFREFTCVKFEGIVQFESYRFTGWFLDSVNWTTTLHTICIAPSAGTAFRDTMSEKNCCVRLQSNGDRETRRNFTVIVIPGHNTWTIVWHRYWITYGRLLVRENHFAPYRSRTERKKGGKYYNY